MHPPNKGCVICYKTMHLTDEYALYSEVCLTSGLYSMHPNMFPRQLAPKTSWFKLDRLASGNKSFITPFRCYSANMYSALWHCAPSGIVHIAVITNTYTCSGVYIYVHAMVYYNSHGVYKQITLLTQEATHSYAV